jgi:hypothetical protein
MPRLHFPQKNLNPVLRPAHVVAEARLQAHQQHLAHFAKAVAYNEDDLETLVYLK